MESINENEDVQILKSILDIGLATISQDEYERGIATLTRYQSRQAEKDEKLLRLEKMIPTNIREDEVWGAKALPCPICGTHMNLIKTFCVNTKFTGYRLTHDFYNCPLSDVVTPIKDTAEEAVLDWNRERR